MARWHEEEQRWTGGRGREEDERRGEWRGGERGSEDRGRERWMSGEHGEPWRGGSRGEEWRERGQERWSSPGGEYERGGRGHEWEEERGGGSERWRAGHVRLGWRGEGGYGGEAGPSYGAGGMYGGAGGMYGGTGGGSWGAIRPPDYRGYGTREHGGRDYGTREYGGRESGAREYGRDYGTREFGRGEWDPERGRMGDYGAPAIYREAGPEFANRPGRWDERGAFERMGDRMKEGFRKLTGRGPKGYKRSDERIREDVSERLARSWVNAAEVEVKVENGEVTLTGYVESREDKRAIEDIAEDVFGVDEVNNHLRVHRGERTTQTFTAGSAERGTGLTAGTGSSTGAAMGTGTASQPGTQPGQRTQQGTTPTQPGRH